MVTPDLRQAYIMAARGIRLPAYSSNIEDWLLHVDVFLALQDDVTDKQKYGALIGALPTSVITKVQHVLIKPPATGKYDALVAALNKRYIREDRMMRATTSACSTSHWTICGPLSCYTKCSAWTTVAPASSQTASSGHSTYPNFRHQCNHYSMLSAATRTTTTTPFLLTKFSRDSSW